MILGNRLKQSEAHSKPAIRKIAAVMALKRVAGNKKMPAKTRGTKILAVKIRYVSIVPLLALK